MINSIRAKIRLLLLILFGVVSLFGLLGSYYLDQITKRSLATVQDNYRAMTYTREMSLALSNVISTLALEDASWSFRRVNLRKAFDTFDRYLELQSQIASDYETLEVTTRLKSDLENLKNSIRELNNDQEELNTLVYIQTLNIQKVLESVYQLNEEQIEIANEEAVDNANRVKYLLAVLGTLFFVFAAFALFYFPNYIGDPIATLSSSIKEIARKNYSQRVPINTNDEFGELASSFNAMAEKLEQYESTNLEQLLNEKKRVETITRNVNEAIIGLDANKIVLFANPEAQRLLNLSGSELLDRSIRDIADENAVFKHVVKELLESSPETSTTYPAVSIDKDGQQFYFNKDIILVAGQTPSEDTSTNIGYLLILKNITALKEQDIAKTHFMARLSHELKTPISAIDMSARLLQDERIATLNEDQKDLTETIQQNANRLLKMVNEILDISKIETGNVDLQYEPIAPHELIEAALDNVKTFLKDKKLEVKIEVSKSLKGAENEPIIETDVQKTTGVLTNFLTNAIRYSPHGGSITVGLTSNQSNIRFSVTDQGPGISAENQALIFLRYKRAKDDTTKGTGLGLAIAKEFIEAQGGIIGVESTLNEGSSFFFELPTLR